MKKEKLDPSKEWTESVDVCVAYWNKRRWQKYEEYAEKEWYIRLLPPAHTFTLPCWTVQWHAQVLSTKMKILALYRYHLHPSRWNPQIRSPCKSVIFIKANFTKRHTLPRNPIICLTNVGLWDVYSLLRTERKWKTCY